MLVPGSKGPKVANGSVHGQGIYTATDFSLGRAYGNGAKECFLCLALPGRQYTTNGRDYGISLKKGYDSHVAGHGPFKGALVFFSSDQLLPCFLVNDQNQKAAAKQADELAMHLHNAILNVPEHDATDTRKPNRSGRFHKCVEAFALLAFWLSALALVCLLISVFFFAWEATRSRPPNLPQITWLLMLIREGRFQVFVKAACRRFCLKAASRASCMESGFQLC